MIFLFRFEQPFFNEERKSFTGSIIHDRLRRNAPGDNHKSTFKFVLAHRPM